MKIDILTLFPEMFVSPFNESIIKRAREQGIITINITNIRDFAQDRQQQVDDYPYGGGAGMVLKANVLGTAIEEVKAPYMGGVYVSPG